MDVQNWRVATSEEVIAYNDRIMDASKLRRDKRKKGNPASGDILAVRHQLTTLDMYSYLRARFGAPNGFQNFLRKDDSGNIFHWDFNLKAGKDDVYIVAGSREVHVWVKAHLTDEDWKRLILAIKADFGRVGREKGEFQKTLEKWFVFPNKYAAVAERCAEKHAAILDHIGELENAAPSSKDVRRKKISPALQNASKRAEQLYGNCLELRLLMPVMAEAYINMPILMLCKEEIRNDERRYQSFLRSDIDIKVADLFLKCNFFVKQPSSADEEFKNFKRVMDKRNNAIHGNINPEREKFEIVYFEGKRPLYAEGGDHVATFFSNLERQYDPAGAVKDYEDVQAFLEYVLQCIDPRGQESARMIVEDSYPGWRPETNRVGKLFPDHIVNVYMGVRYDDELKVAWD